MITRLPILLKLENNIYNEIELVKPSGNVIVAAEEAVRKSNSYMAMRKFVEGCTIRIIGENCEIIDKVKIKGALNKMSNKNLEYLSAQITIDHYDGKDFVEGIFKCPRCGYKIISELKNIDEMEIDTRDRISDLKVNFMENPEELVFDIELDSPIEIKTSSQGTEIINNFKMTFPTVEHCINAYTSVGDNSNIKLMYAMFANALLQVNGIDVDNRWNRLHGLNLFLSIQNPKDLKKVTDYINSYGMNMRVEKTCIECGKVWQPFLDTSNFFAFGVQ